MPGNSIHKKAHIIAIANQKGGVGKTTTVANLGAALVTNHSKRILVVDMDPQSHCSKALGFKLTHEDMSLAHVMREPEAGIKHIIRETALDNLHIAPSHIDLSSTEMELAAEVGGTRILAVALQQVMGDYDHIIVDCPPSLGLLAVNGIVAANEVIIPMEAEPLALDGMGSLQKTIDKTRSRIANNIEILGVLVTKFRRGTTLHTGLLEELRNYWGDKVLRTVIHINIAAAEAVLDGMPVVIASPEATAAQDYNALAEEVLKREEKLYARSEEQDS